MIRPQSAIDALTNHQEQCDEDGVMVKVSRQALDEVLAAIHASPQVGAGQEAYSIQHRADYLQCELEKLDAHITWTACKKIVERLSVLAFTARDCNTTTKGE